MGAREEGTAARPPREGKRRRRGWLERQILFASQVIKVDPHAITSVGAEIAAYGGTGFGCTTDHL